ncbi:hypothetical protein Fmac_008911 [Flemingia macrophylla]|uniref:Uncharacterized protein n=1 Tax=Flemingia macrophylla TaxID=520843 RepID=A0ABD1MYR4_9FABA
MASSQSELRKIGLEGFALIDKLYGPSRRSPANDALIPGRREGCWVVHQVSDLIEEPTVVKTKKPQNQLDDLPVYLHKAGSSAAKEGCTSTFVSLCGNDKVLSGCMEIGNHLLLLVIVKTTTVATPVVASLLQTLSRTNRKEVFWATRGPKEVVRLLSIRSYNQLRVNCLLVRHYCRVSTIAEKHSQIGNENFEGMENEKVESDVGSCLMSMAKAVVTKPSRKHQLSCLIKDHQKETAPVSSEHDASIEATPIASAEEQADSSSYHSSSSDRRMVQRLKNKEPRLNQISLKIEKEVFLFWAQRVYKLHSNINPPRNSNLE